MEGQQVDDDLADLYSYSSGSGPSGIDDSLPDVVVGLSAAAAVSVAGTTATTAMTTTTTGTVTLLETLRYSGFLALSLFVIGPLVVGVWRSLWGLVTVAMTFGIFGRSDDGQQQQQQQPGGQGQGQTSAVAEAAPPELRIRVAVLLLGLSLRLLAEMTQNEVGYQVLRLPHWSHRGGPFLGTAVTFPGQALRRLLARAACFSFSVINVVASVLVWYCLFDFLSGAMAGGSSGGSLGFRELAFILGVLGASCAGVFCFGAGPCLAGVPLTVIEDAPLRVFWAPTLFRRVRLVPDYWKTGQRFQETVSIPPPCWGSSPSRPAGEAAAPTFAQFLADQLLSMLGSLMSILAWWGLWTLMDELDQYKVLNFFWNFSGNGTAAAVKTPDPGPVVANSSAVPNGVGAQEQQQQQQDPSPNPDWTTVVFGQVVCAAAYFMQVPLVSAFSKDLDPAAPTVAAGICGRNRRSWLTALHNCLMLVAMLGCVQFWRGVWCCLDMWATVPDSSGQGPDSLVFNYVVTGTVFTVALVCLGCFETTAGRGISSGFDGVYSAPFNTSYEHPWLRPCCGSEGLSPHRCSPDGLSRYESQEPLLPKPEVAS